MPETQSVPTATPAGSRQNDPQLRWVSHAALAAFFFALIAYNFVDIDLWHQMALIRESLAAGHLLKTDPFAYTPTIKPWIDHEWGAGAVAFFTTLWFGGRAILLVKFLIALGTGLLCLRCAEKAGADFRMVGICAPLAIFLAHLGFFAAVRAQVYTFFFTALLMLFWQLDRTGSRLWMIVWLLLFPLWVNLHGGFVVGIGLMGLYCVEQLLRRESIRGSLVALAGMLVETLLTPYGTAYVGYLKRALLMDRAFAPEWRPVWALGWFSMICFAVAVGVVLYAIRAARTAKLAGLMPLAATMVEGTLHRKLLPLFAIAWLCYAPFYLQQTPAGQWILRFMHRRSWFVRAAWASTACVCILAAIRQKPWELSVPQPIYPVGPVQYLEEQKFQGNVMVPFRLGAYVSWKLFPAVKVSLDSRYEEVYPNRVVEDIFNFYQARPGWRTALEKYPTDMVLVSGNEGFSKKMGEVGWRQVYRDKDFELYAGPGSSLPLEDRSTEPFAGEFP